MKQLSLDIDPYPDAVILSMWRDGKNLSEIAAATGIDEMRLVGHVNRLLNAANDGIDFSKFREMM
jgi:hypothetical protein